jgi:hypothetical protein
VKKQSLIYLAIAAAFVFLGGTALYYWGLINSLEDELKSVRAKQEGVLTQGPQRGELQKRAEQPKNKEAQKIQSGEGEINDQDLINQFKQEVERLDRVIARLRNELQKEKDLNVDLRMKLASRSSEKPGVEDSDKKPLESSEDRGRPFGFFRERTANTKAERRAFFQELETGRMTDEELQVHETLLVTAETVEELEDRIAEEKSPTNRRQLRRELQKNKRELEKLMVTERETLLRQYARSLGYKEDQVQQFSDRVGHIVKMTDETRFPSGPPPQLRKFFPKE